MGKAKSVRARYRRERERQKRDGAMASTEVAKVTEDKNAAAAAPVSLGKGAWDCDNNCEIPPDKEAEVFEEIATMDFPYEGIPTIPPRKNMTHLAFFCNGCRYRVEAYPLDSETSGGGALARRHREG